MEFNLRHQEIKAGDTPIFLAKCGEFRRTVMISEVQTDALNSPL